MTAIDEPSGAPMKRQTVNPWTWQHQFGFAQTTAVADDERTVYCSGQTSVDGEGNPVHDGDLRAQLAGRAGGA